MCRGDPRGPSRQVDDEILNGADERRHGGGDVHDARWPRWLNSPTEVGKDLVPHLVNMTKRGADQFGGADYTFDCTAPSRGQVCAGEIESGEIEAGKTFAGEISAAANAASTSARVISGIDE